MGIFITPLWSEYIVSADQGGIFMDHFHVYKDIEARTGGEIYVGVCVDTACSLGVCAERNAMFRMITAGESAIRRVLAIGDGGKAVAPCGACREFMAQLMPGRAGDVEILMDWENERIVTLRDLTPEWWL